MEDEAGSSSSPDLALASGISEAITPRKFPNILATLLDTPGLPAHSGFEPKSGVNKNPKKYNLDNVDF